MKSNSIPTGTYRLPSGETVTIYTPYDGYLLEYPNGVIQRCDRRGRIYYVGVKGVSGDA